MIIQKMSKCKTIITGKTPDDDDTKDVEIAVPLKYWRNVWRNLEMPFINCEINLLLKLSSNCVITNFTITDVKVYVPVVTLWTQDNPNLLQQLKSGFKRTINSNKYQSEPKILAQNQYLNYLIDPSFRGVNRLFVLLFENNAVRTGNTSYFLRSVEMKDYNIKIDGRNFFDQPVNHDTRTYGNIMKIAAGQGDGYTSGCLLDYPYFKEYYKMVSIDLSAQQAPDADPRAIKLINFTANLDRAR